MPYTGGGGAPNPMQIATCSCGTPAAAPGNCGNCQATLQPPFVAVFEIGQGNCNALIDSTGRLLAFFDFGYSTSRKTKPATPFLPCFCDRPMIILSHWDLDHINLIKTQPKALALRWIVPEQAHSDFAGKVMSRIKEAGGELCVVPAADIAHPNEYMTFPWGFVERCSANNENPNGSGLAAFVCVRDGTGPLVPGVASTRGLAPDALGAPAQRARDAAAAVPAEALAQLGMALNLRAVTNLATPVAAAFAASQTIARHAFMSVGECVTAAVRAANCAIARNTEAAIIIALNADLPRLKTRSNAWWNEAVTQLARAARAARHKRSRKKRARTAASRFAYDGRLTKDKAQKRIAVAATAPPQPALPPLNAGLPPFRRDERFILLNGDANFQWIPSMVANRRPGVAVLTAMHHGAIFEDDGTLSSAHVPFAPGSKAARAVERLWRSTRNAGSLVRLVSMAARAFRKPGTPSRDLRVAVSRAARAAAAAVYATDAAHPNEIDTAPWKFGAAAAAATVAALRYRDARIVGIAGVLAATTIKTCGDMDASPIETVIELAAKGIAARARNAPLDWDGVRAAAAGGVDGDLLSHLITIFNEAVTNGQIPLNAGNAGGNAATAHSIIVRDYRRGLAAGLAKNYKDRILLNPANRDVLNDLASAATAAVEASKHLRDQAHRGRKLRRARRHSVRDATNAAANALPGAAAHQNAIFNNVQAILRTSYWTTPVAHVEQAAWFAAILAAEKMAAITVGTSAETIRTILAGAHDDAIRKQAIHASGLRMLRHPRTGRIAYSYGVSNDASRTHEFSNQTKTSGYMGHPHPFAVLRYQAHGWIRRANTPHRARHTAPQGDPDQRHPIGHVALAWDSQHDMPMSDEAFTHQCSTCGRSYTLRS